MNVFKTISEGVIYIKQVITNNLIKIRDWIRKLIGLDEKQKESEYIIQNPNKIMTKEEEWSAMVGIDKQFNYPQGDTLEEMMNDAKKNSIYHSTKDKNSKMTIIINNERTQVCSTTWLYVEADESIEFITSENKHAAIVKCKIENMTYKIICNHVSTLLDFDELATYRPINPMLLIRTNKTISNNAFIWLLSPKAKITWYTKNLTQMRTIYIESEPSYIVNGYIRVQGRDRLVSLAIVVSISVEEDYVYSGTIMFASGRPYIVTYTVITKNDIMNIVAIAPIPHEINIEVQLR